MSAEIEHSPVFMNGASEHNAALPDLRTIEKLHASLGHIIESSLKLQDAAHETEALTAEQREAARRIIVSNLGALASGYGLLKDLAGHNTGGRIDLSQKSVSISYPGPTLTEATELPAAAKPELNGHSPNGNIKGVEAGTGEHTDTSTQPSPEQHGQETYSGLTHLCQVQIIPSSLIPAETAQSESAIEIKILDNTSVQIQGTVVKLNNAEELSLLNALLATKGQKMASKDIRAFGFPERSSHGATKQAFTKAMAALMQKINIADLKLLQQSGERAGRKYFLGPDVLVSDERTEEFTDDQLELLRAEAGQLLKKN